jgi:hypothetical protein
MDAATVIKKAGGGKQKGGKKGRKIGRQKNRKQSHKRYTSERRWVKHQREQIAKHLSVHPNDRQSAKRLAEIV